MKYFPKIVGDRVYLSPISLQDAERYTAWLNDLATTRFLTLASAHITLQGEVEALAALSKQHSYAIVEKGSDELLGNCGLFEIQAVHRSAEAGIFLGDDLRRRGGYGTEALQLLCDYGSTSSTSARSICGPTPTTTARWPATARWASRTLAGSEKPISTPAPTTTSS